MFHDVSSSSLERWSQNMDIRPFQAGETISREAEKGDTLYLVVSGTVSVETGGGSGTGATTTPNVNGTAAFGSWTRGPVAGTNALSVSATGLTGGPLTIIATASAGQASQIIANGGSTSGTAGQLASIPPSVIVKDQHGNPVAGVNVSFAVTGGGGSLTGGAAISDANGVASAVSWTLGAVAGPNSVTASATGLSGSPLAFSAAGVAGAAAQFALASPGRGSATGGSQMPVPPVVKPKELHGNRVSGVPVPLAATAGTCTQARRRGTPQLHIHQLQQL